MLRTRLKREGDIPFSEFMRDALYHLQGGYYTAHVAFGPRGDFYTAAGSPLFAAVVARGIVSWWDTIGQPTTLHVVEVGAGDGRLAAGICAHLAEQLPASVRWRYHIVEVSPLLSEQQRVRLARWVSVGAVDWTPPHSVAQPVFLVANEVLDAFPVERLRRTAKGWERAFVGLSSNDTLEWRWREAESEWIALAEHWLPVPEGHVGELAPELAAFMARCAEYGRPLRAVFFDYGITCRELAAGVRPGGTIRGYARHRVASPLEHPGLIDITADVHWDFALHCAEQAGAVRAVLNPQSTFLMELGITEVVQALSESGTEGYTKCIGEFKRLVLPGGMGERFQVLQCDW
ncbi:class I SAM-dependent methyltransferase [Alicyclobacillus contaminans]|uniref:class I SAM-dependent methyltransferase n=1 Tax=Alicyclobacillus contaminans TaxID=392016 RepID=UPI00040299EB|nr:SAM-dependent methyltransferase [Alicyclobacillus contaminans]